MAVYLEQPRFGFVDDCTACAHCGLSRRQHKVIRRRNAHRQNKHRRQQAQELSKTIGSGLRVVVTGDCCPDDLPLNCSNGLPYDPDTTALRIVIGD